MILSVYQVPKGVPPFLVGGLNTGSLRITGGGFKILSDMISTNPSPNKQCFRFSSSRVKVLRGVLRLGLHRINFGRYLSGNILLGGESTAITRVQNEKPDSHFKVSLSMA